MPKITGSSLSSTVKTKTAAPVPRSAQSVRRKKKRKPLAARRAARKGYAKAKATSKPGQGKRFAALKKSAAAGGAKDPSAVAAAIGRKKYGRKRFSKMATAGRLRKRKRQPSPTRRVARKRPAVSKRRRK